MEGQQSHVIKNLQRSPEMLRKIYQMKFSADHVSRSWNEIRTRAIQEIMKRSETGRYYLGIPFKGGGRSSEPQERSRFLFDAEDLPGLTNVLQLRLPETVEETVRYAKRICRHQFDLLGYEQLDYGPEIDWHRDIVHSKRAPFKPWFKIRYLDFEEVGDSKVIWELNRHQHLTILAKAYLLTGNKDFAEELFREWYDWWQKNPYPIGINWASSLEVAIRSLSWLWVRHLLQGYPGTPGCFHQDLLRALGINGRHIERYLSTYFSPNTHLLGEGVALFFIGTLCPELSAARRWQHLGWEIVLRESSRQVQADGMYFEQSVYYHVYALDFFLHARILASANQISVPPSFDLTLQKMLELLAGLSQMGIPPRLGDDDGGRVFDPQRNRALHVLDPLATGATLFERADLKVTANFCEEMVWLLGRAGVERFDRLSPLPEAKSSRRFENSGIHVMTGTEPFSQQAVIDVGQLGAGRAGHGHADALSLCLTSNHREWLVDSGTFAYVSDGKERDLFRGTAAHNTLQVDGINQADPCGPFAWCSQPEVRVENWIAAEGFDLLVASHDGYCRLSHPVLHRRCIFYLKSHFWLVLDIAEGEGIHQLELSWHLAAGSAFHMDSVSGASFVAEDQSVLALLTTENNDWTREITNGWCSPTYGKRVSSPVVRFRKETHVPVEFATLLHPLPPGCTEMGHLVRITAEDGAGGVHGYVYQTPAEAHYIILSDHPGRWHIGPWACDAALLYCGVSSDGSISRLALSGGSFVEMDHQRIFLARRTVARFEWARDKAGELSCSDENAIDLVPSRGLSSRDIVFVDSRVQNTDSGAS
jgi:hypothetical protein